MKCINLKTGKDYAIKVIFLNFKILQIIRAVKRYNESAEIEAKILEDIKLKGGCDKGIVDLHEYFKFTDKEGEEHFCLVFETLGKSLYDFIKSNKYKGMTT